MSTVNWAGTNSVPGLCVSSPCANSPQTTVPENW